MDPDTATIDDIRAGAATAVAVALRRWGRNTTIDFESIANESAAKACASWRPMRRGRTPKNWGYQRAWWDFLEAIRHTSGVRHVHHYKVIPLAPEHEREFDDLNLSCVDEPFPTADELIELCGSDLAAATIDRLLRGDRSVDIAADEGVTIGAVSHRVRTVKTRVAAAMAFA